MNNQEMIQRLNAVCTALNNLTVSGVQNASNVAGSYAILQEVMEELSDQEETKPSKNQGHSQEQ